MYQLLSQAESKTWKALSALRREIQNKVPGVKNLKFLKKS